ncbi:hypothetical protein Lfu02_32080 [Longispora fulva]|uniref:Uncharacterized protein n=1 Tax=Longispora fulva TaxID=619741 RepID=A0A8J7KLG8_9ACTN|nr:hypothetical protein [Longispora fulva]MBG6139339.1 hypothetical protein [Longispora fulva]GIG58836.1 hypothetical protein Lfu02_32080 [Longispora fulva]
MTLISSLDPQLASATSLDALELHGGGAGLMLGTNRHRQPVIARVFRPEPTRGVLVGGLRCAQLIAFRVLALGAQVVIQSARPAAWQPFTHGVGAPGDAVVYAAPGSPLPAASATRPQLLILDVGAGVGELSESAAANWRTTLAIREELTAWDVDTLVRAHLVLLQPLSEIEAALASSALGLSEVQDWLHRIRADMLTVVSQGSVRWALLGTTAIEQQVIGAPNRF